MKKILVSIFFTLMLIGCQSGPQIKHGPYCASTAASMCRETGINYGTNEMQACIKDVERRCAQAPEITAKPTEFQKCIADVRSDATICELSALGSVKRGVPDSYHQCGARRRFEEERCRERFDPAHVRRSNPAPNVSNPAPQQIIIQQQQPTNNPNACIQDGGGIYCPNYRR
jgi:hypothetical protein